MDNFRIRILQSTTDACLAVRRMEATTGRTGIKGIIQINHGMAEHAARYERFAKELAANGYHVYAHDHRGHGKTTAPDAPLGAFSNRDSLAKVLADMKYVNDHIRKTYPELPVILFGHSMGSILGLNYCLDHSDTIDGAILWNSGVDGGLLLTVFSTLLKIERMFKGSDVPSAIATNLTFKAWNKKFAPNRTEFDWLSRDEVEVDKYVADPLCGFPVTNGLWLDLLEAIRAGANDSELAKIRSDIPIHLQGGGADPCSDFGMAVARLAKRLRNAGCRDVQSLILPETRHEALNEINRDETIGQLIDWLDSRFSAK